MCHLWEDSSRKLVFKQAKTKVAEFSPFHIQTPHLNHHLRFEDPYLYLPIIFPELCPVGRNRPTPNCTDTGEELDVTAFISQVYYHTLGLIPAIDPDFRGTQTSKPSFWDSLTDLACSLKLPYRLAFKFTGHTKFVTPYFFISKVILCVCG